MYHLNYFLAFAKKYGRAIFYMLALILFWTRAIVFLDPDFGWRLKSGELILKTGIQYKDPFSYTMPSFPYVDHAWLQSLTLSYLFPIVGKIGLALIYSLFVFCLFWSACPDFNLGISRTTPQDDL